MKIWHFFFLAKLYLYFRGSLQFYALFNFLLLAYWLLPYWAKLYHFNVNEHFTKLHPKVGVVLSILVLWNDTYFPPLSFLAGFMFNDTTRPSFTYTMEFLYGLFNPIDILVCLAIFGVCFESARRKWKLAQAIAILMLVPPAIGAIHRAPPLGRVEREFYAEQAKAKHIVKIERASTSTPFDVVILQVCSLSWDDLKSLGLDQHPFLSQFDLLFTHFNTVTSYSTPSALRLLRSTCGQGRHLGLYESAPAECMLMQSLRDAGYQTYTLFNHSGKLSTQMADELSRFARANVPMALDEIEPISTNFDGTPIYDNLQTLELWLKQRERKGATDREAVYYNTVSLHGGAHKIKGDDEWYKRDRNDRYKEALNTTFDEFSQFFHSLENGQRDTLVIMVAEHGAALVGSSIQGPDLRDIPLPKITTVPFGVKFIRKGVHTAQRPTLKSDKIVSYTAIPTLIREVLKTGDLSPEAIAQVPEVTFFAENENAGVTIQDHQLYFRSTDQVWKKLPAEMMPEGY